MAYIGTASVNMTSPSAGSVPQNVQSIESATSNPDFTVSSVTWNGSLTAANKFNAGQVYTATVVLTSKNGKEFGLGSFTSVVSGSALVGPTTTIGTGTGNQVSFSVTFNPTEPQSVRAISIRTQPTKLNYTAGEKIDVSSLVATLTYNDGAILDVSFSQFGAYNIGVNPANGTTVAVASHHGIPITVTYNTYTAATSNLTINAASSSNPSKPEDSGVVVSVNGTTGNTFSSTTKRINNQTEITITLDDKKVQESLQTQGENALLTLGITNDVNVVVGQLNGQTVKNMESKEAVLEIKTNNVTYTLPAAQINIDSVYSQIGTQVELKDIKIDVKISDTPQETVKIIENTASKNNYQIVVKPIDFEITTTGGFKTVEVSRFNGYVERMVAIPDGIDPNKITTGIVLNNDGTFSHVPTSVILLNGKYYAKINSLTNSTYTVIYNQKEFVDVTSHWAYESAKDMASRLIIDGMGDNKFAPDLDITRADFATIVVRALGLKAGIGSKSFNDVKDTDWFSGYIKTAVEYKLIDGYGDGIFKPNNKITREEAMVIFARAMKLTGLKTEVTSQEIQKVLGTFSDSKEIADWAKNSIGAGLMNGLISGRENLVIAPKSNITRAEVATIARMLLKKSGLI